MNTFQAHWYEQVRAEHALLRHLRLHGALPCHQLHYLQMVTEKIGKAYFWRANKPPRKSHASFVRFLQALTDRPSSDRSRIARLLGFARPEDVDRWLPTVTPLAYALERLAPSLAGGGSPNPEYPWPWESPSDAPATHDFEIWRQLTESGRGRQLLRVVDAAVEHFPQFA